jgi:hypothetical protein
MVDSCLVVQMTPQMLCALVAAMIVLPLGTARGFLLSTLEYEGLGKATPACAFETPRNPV